MKKDDLDRAIELNSTITTYEAILKIIKGMTEGSRITISNSLGNLTIEKILPTEYAKPIEVAIYAQVDKLYKEIEAI